VLVQRIIIIKNQGGLLFKVKKVNNVESNGIYFYLINLYT